VASLPTDDHSYLALVITAALNFVSCQKQKQNFLRQVKLWLPP